MHARRGNDIGATGQVAKAMMEEAHAITWERGRWVCNEKRLVEDACMSAWQSVLEQVPAEHSGLVQWVVRAAGQMRAGQDELMPWSVRR